MRILEAIQDELTSMTVLPKELASIFELSIKTASDEKVYDLALKNVKFLGKMAMNEAQRRGLL